MRARYFFSLFLSLSLLCFAEEEALLPPHVTISIPMRDGYNLPTDLYLPTNQKPEECPCLLIRSPSGRNHPYYAQLTHLGYVVAIQGTRNFHDAEGKVFPFYFDGFGEHQDGYDTIEWLANSSWSNGKIGTTGPSALGMTQYLLAPTKPPHLVCQYIPIATPSVYHHGLYPQGELLKNLAEGWLKAHERGEEVAAFVKSQPFYNDFWRSFNALEQASVPEIPTIHYGGWYDIFLEGTLAAFAHAQRDDGVAKDHKLVIGPWTHHFFTSDALGDFVVPQEGKNPPLDLSAPRWFNYHMKGEKNGIEEVPPVIYYVMGPFDGSPSTGNVWKSASSWPVASTPYPLYLSPDGTLTEEIGGSSTQKEYIYNPDHPIPTLGGANLFLEAGPKDQRPIEQREDIVLFTSAPLEEEMEITGQIEALIYFACDQNDTDVVLRLTDVYPDGRSILISDTAYRLDVMEHPYAEKSCHGTIPLPLRISLGTTSLVFAKGHQIRLSIAGSNYPRFEKNRNVGVASTLLHGQKTAHNTIFLEGDTPSHLLLPLVRRGERWTTATPPAILSIA